MPYLEPYILETSGTLRSLLNGAGTVAPDDSVYAQIDAISADTFRDYWGTRIFPTYTAKTYNELHTAGGRAWLTDLDPTTVTHKIEPNWHGPTKTLVGTLGALGVKSVLTVGEPQASYTSAQWDDMMGNITDVQDHLLMVNGQNEVNHIRGGGTLPSNWPQIAAAHQETLWNRMATLNTTRAGLGKSAILVGSPNLWAGNISTHHSNLATLAPLVKNYCNVGCFHLYPRGEHPTWKLDEFISEYRKTANYGAGKALWCTESGYFDAVNYTGGAVIVTAWAKAIYVKKQWLEYAKRDIPVSYFEFLDDVDPGDSNREASLGLINTPAISQANWQAKPSYTGLKTMLAHKGGVTGKVSCDISAVTSNVEMLAVNSSTGTLLYIWRTENVENNKTPVTLNPISVTISSPNITTTTVNITADVVVVPI